jgi:hypothetical protein
LVGQLVAVQVKADIILCGFIQIFVHCDKSILELVVVVVVVVKLASIETDERGHFE